MKSIVFILLFAFVVPGVASAQTAEDEAAVREAVLNYVEGFYEGDSTKIALGVYPDVNKRGFFLPQDSSTGEYEMTPMSFDQMIEYTRRVQSSGRMASPDAPKDIVILDLLDQTASVKLSASWGTDYLLLAKTEGEWRIWQVLWQTYPPKDN